MIAKRLVICKGISPVTQRMMQTINTPIAFWPSMVRPSGVGKFTTARKVAIIKIKIKGLYIFVMRMLQRGLVLFSINYKPVALFEINKILNPNI